MFGNMANNNNTNDRGVNTKIRTWFGELSCLQLSYWNDKIAVKINPLSSVSNDGLRQYDYTRRANTALTAEKCLALYKKLKKKILPIIEGEESFDGNPINVGVTTNNNGTALFVEYKNDENGVPYVYLTVYTNIGTDNKAPEDGTYKYKFEKTEVIENYDSINGTATTSKVDSEFIFFYEKLKNVADVYGTSAHSVNVNNSFKPSAPKNNYNNTNNSSNNYSAPVSDFSSDEFPF